MMRVFQENVKEATCSFNSSKWNLLSTHYKEIISAANHSKLTYQTSKE